MLLTDNEIRERMDSPLNLLNRLRTAVDRTSVSPCLPPTSSDIIEDLEEKVAFGSIKSKANSIISSALDELKTRLPEVHKPEKLAQIAAEMSKVINGTKVNIEDNRKIAQVVIYAPQLLTEEAFEVIEVNE